MSGISLDPGAAAAAALPDRDVQLRRVSQQLEGVFVEHLFKAMRETVPDGGLIDGGSGEEIFTSLLDRHIADEAALGWDRGIGAAIYRQLRTTVTTDSHPADTSPQKGSGE